MHVPAEPLDGTLLGCPHPVSSMFHLLLRCAFTPLGLLRLLNTQLIYKRFLKVFYLPYRVYVHSMCISIVFTLFVLFLFFIIYFHIFSLRTLHYRFYYNL